MFTNGPEKARIASISKYEDLCVSDDIFRAVDKFIVSKVEEFWAAETDVVINGEKYSVKDLRDLDYLWDLIQSYDDIKSDVEKCFKSDESKFVLRNADWYFGLNENRFIKKVQVDECSYHLLYVFELSSAEYDLMKKIYNRFRDFTRTYIDPVTNVFKLSFISFDDIVSVDNCEDCAIFCKSKRRCLIDKELAIPKKGKPNMCGLNVILEFKLGNKIE